MHAMQPLMMALLRALCNSRREIDRVQLVL
jgi:hypothetical protein